MAGSYLYVIPILICVWFPLTFMITYIISACLRHINLVWPYISDTGAYAPESCVFSQLVNLGCLMVLACMYIRYRYAKEIIRRDDLPPSTTRLNRVNAGFGYVACAGMSVVGNFQETNAIIAHLCGASLSFGIGGIYLILNTILTYKLGTWRRRRHILIIRVILSVIANITFCIVITSGYLAEKQFHGKDIPKWSKADGGWTPHLISTINEWINAFTLMLYFLTHSSEFREIQMFEPEINIDEPLLLVA